ncbi:MAG: ACP S-malonyltransferase [Oscillospiraceae bacterium]|nr:ACP S-malonyltransferase [Oscillospiraceae bacterium]
MKIAFLFAGQGAQKIGMGADLYRDFPRAREIYDSIDLDFDVKKLCFEGPAELLNDTAFAQSCIVATSLATANILKEAGIKPDYVAGLSLGEYSALAFAEAMTAGDACRIARRRGRIMADALPAGTSKMVAVMAMDEEKILEACQAVQAKGMCSVANYNAPGQIVITGENRAVDRAVELLKAEGLRRAIPLNVSGRFHSPLLENASCKLADVLSEYNICQPEIPVVYNVTGSESGMPVPQLLTQQIKSSVRFMQSVEYMLAQGVDTFIEIGPGNTLAGFVRRIDRNVTVSTAENTQSVQKILEVLK